MQFYWFDHLATVACLFGNVHLALCLLLPTSFESLTVKCRTLLNSCHVDATVKIDAGLFVMSFTFNQLCLMCVCKCGMVLEKGCVVKCNCMECP